MTAPYLAACLHCEISAVWKRLCDAHEWEGACAGAVKDPWQGCTGPVTGLDQGTLSACMSGNDGEALLKKSIGETEAMSIRASPTWIVNGKYKFSGIDAETIKDAICAHNTLGGCSVHLSGPPSRSRP